MGLVKSAWRALLAFPVCAALAAGCGTDDDSSAKGGSADAGASAAGEPGAAGAGTAKAGSSGKAGGGAVGEAGTGGTNSAAGGEADGGFGPSAAGEAGSAGAVNVDSLSQTALLHGLGFSVGTSAPVDGSGHTLPPDFNPLRGRFSTYQPKAELYMAGMTGFTSTTPAKQEILWDNATAGTKPTSLTFASEPDSWADVEFKNGIAADIDGDGLDEIFIVYYVKDPNKQPAGGALKYVIIDYLDQKHSGGTLLSNVLDPPATLADWALPALAKGDFNGSGHDQVAMGWLGLYIIDFNQTTEAPTAIARALGTVDVPADQDAVFVAAGDLDGDANDELAVTYSVRNKAGGKLRIYDDAIIAHDQDLKFFNSALNQYRSTVQAQVTIGDFDGDRLGDIALFGETEGGGWEVFLHKNLHDYPAPAPGTTDAEGQGWRSDFSYLNGVSAEIPHPFAAVDFDGDGTKDLFAQYRVLDLAHGTSTNGVLAPKIIDVETQNYGLNRVAVGDVDGDGKEDVVLADYGTVYAYGLNVGGAVESKRKIDGPRPDGNDLSSGHYTQLLVAGNVDNDSDVLHYTGKHEVQFTDPSVVAVLSSPPYYADTAVGQDVMDTNTSFGSMNGTKTDEMKSLEFSVGFTLGYSVDIEAVKWTSTITVEKSFGWTSHQTHTSSTSITYTTSDGKDLVVFTSIPFDVYEYEITSLPDRPKMTIDMPRTPLTLAAEPDFYNTHTKTDAFKVDDKILTHTVGLPHSYPSSGIQTTLQTAPGYVFGPGVTVPVSGSIASGIQTGDNSGTGKTGSIGFSVSSQIAAKTGPIVGLNYGLQSAFSYELLTTTATTYAGTVGYIPPPAHESHVYTFGIVAYQHQMGTDPTKNFLMVDYWVQ